MGLTGLTFQRYFTKAGHHPYTDIQWVKRSAIINDEKGHPVFEQHDIEVPSGWSQTATNIVASKYFRGKLGTLQRENSVRSLIDRVVGTIYHWALKQGYFSTEEDELAFRDELTHLLVHQKAAFNSPVWFNVGSEEHPQSSACFINSVQDTMESILGLARTEGMLFKHGSGTGSNLSTLRSSKESLGGGGTASGPVSFMRGYDAFAGVIKSGGKTRRAAKMVILNADHPDIVEFVNSKADEEKKAHALIDAGYDGSFNVHGGAYDSVFFQNANHSVRVTDEFMRAIEEDREWSTKFVKDGQRCETMQARDLMKQIATAAWNCGDPGIQYDTTINSWHTCPESGRINGSNPCSEYMFLDDTACNLSSINLMKFVNDDGEFNTDSFQAACRIMITAQEILVDNSSYPTPEIETNSYAFRPLGLGYANLGVLLMDRGLPYDSDAGRSFAAAVTALMHGEAYAQSARIAAVMGPFSGYMLNEHKMLEVVFRHREKAYSLNHIPESLRLAVHKVWDTAYAYGNNYGYRNSQVTVLAPTGTIGFMMDCFVGDTLVAVADGRNAVSFQQLAEEGKDVDVYASENGRTVVRTMRNPRRIKRSSEIVKVTLDDGSSVRCTSNHKFLLLDGTYCEARDLTPGTSLMRFDSVVTEETGLPRRKIWMGPEAGSNYRGKGNVWKQQYSMLGAKLYPGYTGRNGGLIHHNNEDTLDDSSDNLRFCTSIGEHQRKHWAVKSPKERSQILRDRQASRSLEAKKESSRKAHEAQTPEQRKARAALAVLAHTTEECAEWSRKGWEGLVKNVRTERANRGWETRRTNQAILHNHKVVSVISDGEEDTYCGEVDGTHNFAIVTSGENPRVDSLSGVIVHNCDTTGVEPDIALVKYKKLVGGGVIKIVNQSVPKALNRLSYDPLQCEAIVRYIDENEMIEGAPHLKPEHLSIFDCAFPAKDGKRFIHWMGHIKMMSAVQPFLSGAISKTVNMPNSATVDEIQKAYMEGWKLGLKAIAVYRDGCKRSQPLSTSKESVPVPGVALTAVRRKLPNERHAITHKFQIAGHEGYITVGMYEDGKPGEIFLVMAKEGSTISGLMDAFATSISMSLQYGVPLETLIEKFSHVRFEPSGFTRNPDIPYAKSLTDYIFRWLSKKFIDVIDETPDATPAIKTQSDSPAIKPQSDAPPCHYCGSIMVRNGSCYRCANCGSTSGCS